MPLRSTALYLSLCYHFLNSYFQAENIEVKDVDFNPEFINRMLPRLEWRPLVETAQKVSENMISLVTLIGPKGKRPKR